MAQSSSQISGVAQRYALSLFALAEEAGVVPAIEAELKQFQRVIDESDDLKRLIESPVFSAEDQLKAIGAIAGSAGMSPLASNFLQVVARNRRLFAVPAMIRAFADLAASARGEVAASVVSAHALDAGQQAELAATLREVAGKDVTVDVKVDPSLLGGLIVRMGSRQIDTSLKTKLNALELALKEVG